VAALQAGLTQRNHQRRPACLHQGLRALASWSMIRKSVQRFSEKIMLNQKAKAR
jgi:hypothetical protein